MGKIVGEGGFDTEPSPAQKTMRKDIERRDITAEKDANVKSIGEVFDEAVGQNAVDELRLHSGAVWNLQQLALNIINEYLPDHRAGLKEWQQIQNAVEAGIRLGIEKASPHTRG